MRADEDDLVPQRRIRARYLGEDIVAVEIVLVGPGPDLDAQLRYAAKRQGVTIAEITRAALETHLGSGARRRLGAAGAGASGECDISERIEEIIASEIGPSR